MRISKYWKIKNKEQRETEMSEYVKNIRITYGLSQVVLAKLSGVSVNEVGRIERGEYCTKTTYEKLYACEKKLELMSEEDIVELRGVQYTKR